VDVADLTAEGPGGGDHETQEGCIPARPYGSSEGEDGRALLFALDADTGELVGALNGSGFRSPVVVNETLYVASQHGCVYGVGTERSSNASRIRMSPDRSGASSDEETEPEPEPDGGNETHDTDANDSRENTTRPPNERNESTDPAPAPGLAVVGAILGALATVGTRLRG
jgi:outer membrane protein assembly factor BamB